jgi:hypothetical protein
MPKHMYTCECIYAFMHLNIQTCTQKCAWIHVDTYIDVCRYTNSECIYAFKYADMYTEMCMDRRRQLHRYLCPCINIVIFMYTFMYT